MASREDLDIAFPPNPVIEAYKKDVDRTLLRERLKLTVDQRLRQLEQFQADAREIQRAGRDRR
jgi:hypothetical protein